MSFPSISTETTVPEEPRSRAALRMARRVVIKAGTSVVANADGSPSLTRLGSIVEQIAELHAAGVQVIFVSSGAVGMGRNLLRKQARLNMSFLDMQQNVSLRDSLNNKEGLTPATSISDLLEINDHMETSAAKSCAAAGQFELMNLYQSLFSPKGITASQLLLTQADFADDDHITNVSFAMERLLNMGIVPIVNENDAVCMAYNANEKSPTFLDNDSLAALCARHFHAEVLLLLTDVAGVYTHPPSDPKAQLVPFYKNSTIAIGEKSTQGRGGMSAKIKAAEMAVQPGSSCAACVVACGSDLNIVRSVLGREYQADLADPPRGTLFATPGSDLEQNAFDDFKDVIDTATEDDFMDSTARDMAIAARREARKLLNLPLAQRQAILKAVADALMERQDELIQANQLDLEAAANNNTAQPLVKRLKLTNEKLQVLATGIRQLADRKDPLNVLQERRELAEGLELRRVTVPLGVLLIIFESRPDSMPQIVSLALATANGLLLKGGKEAVNSNTVLHQVIGDAIEEASKGEIGREIVGLVKSRGQVKDLLALDDVIDLVIPRGSNSLVSYIQKNTHIPVMGHADGVCHVYVHESADVDKAVSIVVDSKTDYPSACNAMETLLLHEDTVNNGIAAQVMMGLRAAGVKCLGGPRAMVTGLTDGEAQDYQTEYGDLTCMVEVVSNLDEAVQWIRDHGSGHTEAIVCGVNDPVGDEFIRRVDAACVFRNASTRFADGFRMGLGAEVGISTGRIHARGPVGVEGLLTSQWQLRSNDHHFAAQFAGDAPAKTYTHINLPITD